MGCVTEPDQTRPSSVTQTFDISRQKSLGPHQLGTAEDQTVTVLVCVAKPNSRLRADWEPCGSQSSYLSGRFPVAWLPACLLFLQPLAPRVYGCFLIQQHGLSLHAHLVLCCALPASSTSLIRTAQHGVLGLTDALTLTLLGELGRSAPEVPGPRSQWESLDDSEGIRDIGSKGLKRLSSPKQYSLNRA